MIRAMPNLSHTAYGTWSAGKYMHFGEALDDAAFRASIRAAYDAGIRTFVTADVYGVGRADEALGEALAGVDRSSYALAGIIGHDFYTGTRQGNAGYPRFTAPDLRSPRDYRDYVRMAVEKSLERCRTDRFDLLMLHNPDEIGYTREEVWEALRETRDNGLTDRLGIAPGPANGFTLDIIHCFERYAEAIDWAMIILSPHEPWPGHYVLPSARRHGVEILTRVVDHGGIFWDDVKPGHVFKPGDHRTYRPQGWVEDRLRCGNPNPGRGADVVVGRTLADYPSSYRGARPIPPADHHRRANRQPGFLSRLAGDLAHHVRRRVQLGQLLQLQFQGFDQGR